MYEILQARPRVFVLFFLVITILVGIGFFTPFWIVIYDDGSLRRKVDGIQGHFGFFQYCVNPYYILSNTTSIKINNSAITCHAWNENFPEPTWMIIVFILIFDVFGFNSLLLFFIALGFVLSFCIKKSSQAVNYPRINWGWFGRMLKLNGHPRAEIYVFAYFIIQIIILIAVLIVTGQHKKNFVFLQNASTEFGFSFILIGIATAIVALLTISLPWYGFWINNCDCKNNGCEISSNCICRIKNKHCNEKCHPTPTTSICHNDGITLRPSFHEDEDGHQHEPIEFRNIEVTLNPPPPPLENSHQWQEHEIEKYFGRPPTYNEVMRT